MNLVVCLSSRCGWRSGKAILGLHGFYCKVDGQGADRLRCAIVFGDLELQFALEGLYARFWLPGWLPQLSCDLRRNAFRSQWKVASHCRLHVATRTLMYRWAKGIDMKKVGV